MSSKTLLISLSALLIMKPLSVQLAHKGKAPQAGAKSRLALLSLSEKFGLKRGITVSKITLMLNCPCCMASSFAT